ncbi:MAG: iron-containing alcohol dehydrogenase [Thermoguttaceae bacterium]|jgi:alcohol dehydrogenase class IV|nr:iron-containing alcohol dehydrogenase [Thermoguttaceae bacterium]
MLTYDFIAPARVVFGWGRRAEIGVLGRDLGRRALVFCGLPDEQAAAVLPRIADALHAEQIDMIEAGAIDHEPEASDVDEAAAGLRELGVGAGDFLVAVGGGAAIDLAKAVAAMALTDQDDAVADYLEGVGQGLKLQRNPLPLMALPTTAGTGAEATYNAVISNYDPPWKKSFRDPRLTPRIALVDPELGVSVPPAVTAASGMDAITQLIESFISRKAQPIPQALCVQGLRLAVPAIAEAVENGASRAARERMSHAALLSGMALANSGLGLAHGVAPALGTHCRVPHGVACAIMLPVALRINRQSREEELARLAHVLYSVTSRQSPAEAVDRLIEEIERLCARVGIPRRLSDVGVRPEQIPAIACDSFGNSMRGNPVDLTEQQVVRMLQDLL